MSGRRAAVEKRRKLAANPIQDARLDSHSLVASAARYPGKSARIYVPAAPWQEECYRHYSICGEARYAANYFGNAVGKLKLGVGEPQEDGSVKPLPLTSNAGQVMEALFAGSEGQTAMLTAIGKHLTIAGECYLVGREASGDFYVDRREAEQGEDIWEVVPVTEMNKAGDVWSISYGDGFRDVQLEEDDLVLRIWIPNPAKRMEADSPFRSLLPILSEIEWLTQNIFSQITSRLTGGGIFFVPHEITFPPPPEVNGKPQNVANDAEGLVLRIGASMSEARDEPGDPSSQVPVIVQAPAEYCKQMKDNLVHFWSPMDEHTLTMRKDAVMRFALGMDLPPERVLGMGVNPGAGGGTSNGVSHWGAWQIDEDTVKLHVEPIGDVIIWALTLGYLRPNTGGAEVVTSDSTGLRVRPDRSKESLELYDRGELNGAALRRENRFDETDAMDEREQSRWLTKKIAGGSATPEMVTAAARSLGVDLPLADTVPNPDGPPQGVREARPDPSLEDHPTRREPDAAALLHTSEALALRALERAGNRLRQRFGKDRPDLNCSAFEMHTLLEANGSTDAVMADAFPTADIVLDGVADAAKVVPVLDAYCRTLIAEQAPHDRARLAKFLEKVQ